ncbi:endopeptidase La [Aquihabitans sp. G128]|uniref:endopeptidase La n=1 Tax=Aquihabitans sp. G128 TaxID=2849779 RepID=UPI001C2326F9|nr:endopeptidase La [Aquihabitans sp. G128]QXC61237.1 endopeptidase La [Aquihabitans sp. G128]
MSDTETSTLTLPVLPLTSGVVLPGMVLTIALETDDAKAAVEAAGDDGRLLLVPRVDGRHANVGTVATIESRGTLPSGIPALVVRATDRALLRTGVAGTGTVLWLEAEPVHPEVTDEAREKGNELRAAFRALFEQLGGRRLVEVLRGLDEPDALADAAGWWPDLSLERKVELLETIDVAERVGKVLSWAKEALAEAELTERIRTEVTDGLEKNQREFILRQQLAAIRKELGEGDGDGEEGPDAYRTKVAERNLPEAVRVALERDIDKLERSSEQSPEHGWIRTWLDTVLDLPWGERSADKLDLVHARAVLDADHKGLDEVKDRIVEELAVRKLRADRGLDATGGPSPAEADQGADPTGGSTDPAVVDASDEATDHAGVDVTEPELVIGTESGPQPVVATGPRGRQRNSTILTLVGPPGVGKTSLGESIARALGRSFVRVALGGVRDEAEIRGHRRTYVGAQPGRLVRAMAEAGTMNPVVLLDEIDKVGNDYRGDPSAALLEVLDPAQNHAFRDHYLEVELDLSDVIFIATANQLDTIPGPLLDRMEVVSLDGYTEDEKVAIARDHLLVRQLERAGLGADEVTVSDDALRAIVGGYTREAGVRSLERALAKVLRKVATKVAVTPGEPVAVTPETVPDLLGRARFHDTDIADRVAVPGVATGLAVTGAGGDVLFVEVSALPADDGDAEKSALTVTGQLGDVMKESARIALSYVRAHRDALAIPAGADRRNVHVHFPAGAVPKDGPSAGITMTTALVSLFTGRPVKANVAMTGEVTLQGRVLPIGGVKQKLLAAHRLGLTEIIIPARNEPDLDDLPQAVRDELTVHLASDVADVIGWALEPAPEQAAAA